MRHSLSPFSFLPRTDPPRPLRLYLSILSLGPARTRPAHESYWTGMGRDFEAREKESWLEPGPKCCF
jgi:hypothetical protein